MKYYLQRAVVIFIFLYHLTGICSLNAQIFQFTGNISDTTGLPVTDCFIILIDQHSNEVLEFAIPDKNGIFQITIAENDSISNVKLQCQGLSYKLQEKRIALESGKSQYIHDFRLQKVTFNLDEVIILAEKIPVVEKNDTVIFDVSSFKQFDDKKIIHVLKNMPGFTVNEKTGLIQYKGKPIETILIEGDDLFGKGYAIGARTISTDVVEKIEAIEDYHPNRLEKGLTRSDKVVLNLKLKHQKLFSGEIGIGIGPVDYIGNGSLVNFSKKWKGLGVLQANNISHNETSFQEDAFRTEFADDILRFSIDNLNNSSITRAEQFDRSYINALKYGTYSNLNKFSEKISLKTSISIFRDTTYAGNETDITFSLSPNNTIKMSNELSNSAVYSRVLLSNELNFDISKSALLKYSNNFQLHQDVFNQANLQNNTNLFNTLLGIDKAYFRQSILFSKKISDDDLIKFTFSQSNDSRNQTLKLLNGRYILFENIFFNQEKIKANRSILDGNITYFKNNKKFDAQYNLLFSHDRSNTDLLDDRIKQYSHLRQQKIAANATLNLRKWKKLPLQLKPEIGFSKRRLEESQNPAVLSKSDVFLNFSGNLKYSISSNKNLIFSIEQKAQFEDYSFLLKHPVMIDTRNIISGIPSLTLQRNLIFSGSFQSINFLKQSNISVSSSFTRQKNATASLFHLNESFAFITIFQSPLHFDQANASFETGFFIEPLKSKMKISGQYSFNQFYNALNDIALNSVKSNQYNLIIELNSAFDFIFNFRSSFSLSYFTNKIGTNRPILNTILLPNIEAVFKITPKTYFRIKNELFIPRETKFNWSQFFLDARLTHTEKKFEYFLFGRNLLNYPAFQQIAVNEFSTTILSKTLFDRSIVLGLSYTF